MTDTPTVAIAELTPGQFRDRSAELIAVYLAAMRYPAEVADARSRLWGEHSTRTGFRALAAIDAVGQIRGLAYGYRGAPGQWWYSQVRRGLKQPESQWLSDYFELTELHVRPDSQGAGLGELLLRRLLDGLTESTVLLSTPEGDNRAWRLYRRVGFSDVLRNYRFDGDVRPFGVLGRSLPLPG